MDKILYKGKTYIENGDTFLYRVRLPNMSEYVLLTKNEIKVGDSDINQLALYRRNVRKGKPFMAPYKLNPNRENK